MTTVNPEISPGNPELSRRERVHRATKTDLVAAARALLVEQGMSAVTVRAVAAKLGMTAPAIYRYYPSRELMLEDVIDLLYGQLADHLEAACETQRDGSLTERFMVTARAFRRWALDNRPEFGLLFGAPIPGVRHQTESEDWLSEDSRGIRFMLVWLRLFLEIPAVGIHLAPWPRPIPEGLRSQLTSYLQRLGQPQASVEMAMLFLVSWQSLYGFICTETFGHLDFVLDDSSEMFDDWLEEFRERLQLP